MLRRLVTVSAKATVNLVRRKGNFMQVTTSVYGNLLSKSHWRAWDGANWLRLAAADFATLSEIEM